MKAQFATRLLVALAFLMLGVSRVAAPPSHRRLPTSGTQSAQYMILMIADGWGFAQIQAAESYTGTHPPIPSGPTLP